MSIPLNAEIKQYFPKSSKNIVNTLLTITTGIFESETTNLNKVKQKMGRVRAKPEVDTESHYKFILRFFDLSLEEKQLLIQGILLLIFTKLKVGKRSKRYLILDGLSWQNGSKKVHLLVLSILVNGVSIPIYWHDLDKKGKSNLEERKSVINQAFKLFDFRAYILLADREYDGIKWFKYLKTKGLNFVIRLKKGSYRSKIDAKSGANTKGTYIEKARYSYLEKLAYCQKFRNCGVSKKFEMGGEKYTFVVLKNPKQEAKEPLIYFISTLPNKKHIIKAYPLRWKIETCFKNIQSNGFNLTENAFQCSKKIELLMAMVVLLYVFAFIEGTHQYKNLKSSDFKNYADGKVYLAISIFRKGYAVLINSFHNAHTFFRYIQRTILKTNLVLRI